MFGGGDIFSDMLINGARNDAAHARQRVGEYRNANESLLVENQRLHEGNSSNLSIRFALAAQLKLVDPDNPLLTDPNLIQQIARTAVAAVKRDNDFDAAREVGSTYPIPGRRPKVQPPQLLPKIMNKTMVAAAIPSSATTVPIALYIEACKELAGTITLRNAYATQLKKFDPKNSLIYDLSLATRLVDKGIAAYRMSGDFKEAGKVGDTFPIPTPV